MAFIAVRRILCSTVFGLELNFLHISLIVKFDKLTFEALEEKEGQSKITLVHQNLDTEHLFKVIDNGSGIDKKDIEFIFSPGFSTKINYQTGQINRGLGLSLVKDIVENHLKGRIQIESSLGSGTSFSIYIPKKEIEVSI